MDPGDSDAEILVSGRYRRLPVDERQTREMEEARSVLLARKQLYGDFDPATFDARLS